MGKEYLNYEALESLPAKTFHRRSPYPLVA